MDRTETFTRASFISAAGLSATALAAGVAATSALGVEPAASKDAVEQISDADVIIVGAGLAGLTAGLRAIELGCTPLIIDKMPEGLGGNSALAGGTFSVPMTQDEQGYQGYVDAYAAIAEGRNDTTLLRTQAERAQTAIDWLVGYGCDFPSESVQEKPFDVNHYVVNPGSFRGMGPLMETLLGSYLDAGGTALFETKMLDLVRDDTSGIINGVLVRDASGIRTLHAGAVLIATGGYCGNDEMLERWIGENADDFTVRGHRYLTGDGISAANRMGAMLKTMAGMQSIHVAAVSPDNIAFGNPGTAVPYCVAINAAGKRFVDESRGYQHHGKAVIDQPEAWDALIFDQAELNDPECATIGEKLSSFEANGIPYVVADSLDELAEKIGVDATALKVTLDEYNGAIIDGAASNLEVPKAELAYPVATAPFYAFAPLKPGCTLTFGGIYVDEKAQALEADGTPIPGLYAAGEATGGFFAIDYIAGGALTRAVVFGLIAAESMVKFIGK